MISTPKPPYPIFPDHVMHMPIELAAPQGSFNPPSGGLNTLGGSDLLAVLVVSDTRGWGAVAAAHARADTNDLAVDGARNAVLQLEVHLGNGVLGEDRGVRDITNSSRLDHVADGEALDRLVLGCASAAVGAADGIDVAAALLVAAVVLSLLGHFGGW